MRSQGRRATPRRSRRSPQSCWRLSPIRCIAVLLEGFIAPIWTVASALKRAVSAFCGISTVFSTGLGCLPRWFARLVPQLWAHSFALPSYPHRVGSPSLAAPLWVKGFNSPAASPTLSPDPRRSERTQAVSRGWLPRVPAAWIPSHDPRVPSRLIACPTRYRRRPPQRRGESPCPARRAPASDTVIDTGDTVIGSRHGSSDTVNLEPERRVSPCRGARSSPHRSRSYGRPLSCTTP